MFRRLALIILFCLQINLLAVAGSISDSVVARDSSNQNLNSFQRGDTGIVITFDESKLAPRDVRMIFNNFFNQYLKIKDALVYNDSYNAVRNTLQLLDDMKTKTKDIDILNKDDRWIFFVKNFDEIKKKIEATTFISEQRFLFNEITSGICEFIKQYGLSNKTIYLYQCPTGTDIGVGSWLSDLKDRKNPYLGLPKDTACAKVKEVWLFK